MWCITNEAQAVQIKPQRKGAWIRQLEVNPCKIGNFKNYWKLPMTWQCHIHNSCQCNEIVSLQNRVLQRVPQTQPRVFAVAKTVARKIGTWVGPHQPLNGEWIENYTGRKRTIYRNAKANVEQFGLGKRKAKLKSFIKLEKIADPTRDPRTIQARSPEYNYLIGNYFKAFEHKLYNIRGTRNLRKILPNSRCIAKCLSLVDRGNLIRDKMGQFKDPVCMSIDCSRFDSHVTKQQLVLEHMVYKKINQDPIFHKLLDLQYDNTGFTKHGLMYHCPGGRMSGDMNTAQGNCVLMLIMIVTARILYGPVNYDIFVDGDDTLIFVDRKDLGFARYVMTTLNEFGHEVKLENVATELEDVVHCQSKPVQIDQQTTLMVQDPTRVFSRYMVSVRNWRCSKTLCSI